MKINMYKTLSFLTVSCLVVILYVPSAHALASVDFAIREICSHMQGSLGGLLMAAAGVGGVASAAFGNMKAMYSCLVTGIGAFGISAVLSLHFQDAYAKCSGSNSVPPPPGARTVQDFTQKNAEVSGFDPESAAKKYISYSKNEDAEVSETDKAKSESDVTEEVKAENTQDEDSDLELF